MFTKTWYDYQYIFIIIIMILNLHNLMWKSGLDDKTIKMICLNLAII
jgi:hypothetical protein